MGVLIAPESELGQELDKWETHGRYVHKPFPKMIYMAFPRENGKVMCGDPGVAVGDAVAEAFTRRCQRTVQNEAELERAQAEGWRQTPDGAIAYYEGLQRDIATAAAEANFHATSMTPKAQAERSAREKATHKQIPE
jgi:hypothetical protein